MNTAPLRSGTRTHWPCRRGCCA